MRGTFGQDRRFRHYKALAFSKSNPNLGPGTHDDFVSFKTINKRACKALMMPQIFEDKELISDSKSRFKSAMSAKNKTNTPE